MEKTNLSQIELVPNGGAVQVRLVKQVSSAKGVVISEENHRFIIAWGVDPDEQMDAVDKHLDEMGFPAIDAADRGVIKAMAAAWREQVTAQVEAQLEEAKKAAE